MNRMKKRVAAALTAAILAAALAVPAMAAKAPAIRVSSYKGNTLEIGERSGLIIGPGGTDYTVTSSDPDTVAVEQVLTFWVAVAKSEGSAEITVTNEAGDAGRLALTVGVQETGPDPASIHTPGPAPAPSPGEDAGLSANMEIRQEMIRLINEVRREHGVAELPAGEAVMNAAQAISAQCRTDHGTYEWEALLAHGWPHGGSNNKTSFNQTSDGNIAQHAVENWVNSPPHLQNLLRSDVTCLGTGVTVSGEMVYCHMFVGDPDGIGPL